MSLSTTTFMFFPPHISGVTGGGGRIIQRLTGTTSQSSTALETGTRAVIVNSADTPIAVRFTAGASTALTTDLEIPRSGFMVFDTDDNTQIVSAIASDGASTFECWVWNCGPAGS